MGPSKLSRRRTVLLLVGLTVAVGSLAATEADAQSARSRGFSAGRSGSGGGRISPRSGGFQGPSRVPGQNPRATRPVIHNGPSRVPGRGPNFVTPSAHNGAGRVLRQGTNVLSPAVRLGPSMGSVIQPVLAPVVVGVGGDGAAGPISGPAIPPDAPAPDSTNASDAGVASGLLLVNPEDTQSPVNYQLNGQPFELQPGYNQQLGGPSTWVIEFDRGNGNGLARYTLTDGTYLFTLTDAGWELYLQAADSAGE